MALELGLPPGHAWDNQLLRYHEGQAYREHTDCIPGTAVAGGRDRSVTTLIYLSDVEVRRAQRACARTHAYTHGYARRRAARRCSRR